MDFLRDNVDINELLWKKREESYNFFFVRLTQILFRTRLHKAPSDVGAFPVCPL